MHWWRDCMHSRSIYVPLASLQVTCMSCDYCGFTSKENFFTLDSFDFHSVVVGLRAFLINLCPIYIHTCHVHVMWPFRQYGGGIAGILGQFVFYLHLCMTFACHLTIAASQMHRWRDILHSWSFWVPLVSLHTTCISCDHCCITDELVAGLHAFWVNFILLVCMSCDHCCMQRIECLH